MRKRYADEDRTQFLNVDLDVLSKAPLNEIVDALGEKVFVLYVGKWGRRFSAHFELAGYWRNRQADQLISQLVRLIKRLPKAARRRWNEADAREFNIGIESAKRSPAFELRLQPDTLAGVAGIRGRIVVTVYAPERVLRTSHHGRRRKRSRPSGRI